MATILSDGTRKTIYDNPVKTPWYEWILWMLCWIAVVIPGVLCFILYSTL